MTKLTELGFYKDVIVETIVSTYSLDGKPNAAPMGAILQNEQQIILNLFNTSKTLANLKEKKVATINLTRAIEVFFKTTFKEANPEGVLPLEIFEKAQTIDAPKLTSADGVIEVEVQDFMPFNEQKTTATCNVKLIQAVKKLPQAFCRADSAVLEAIIHATRVKALINDEKSQKQVSKLIEQIDNACDVVNRVAPNSSHKKIMADLDKMIGLWRLKK